MKIKFRGLWKQHDDTLNGMSNMMFGFLDEVIDNRNKMKSASRNSKSAETVESARLQRLRHMNKWLSDLEDSFVDKQKGKTALQDIAHDYKNIIDDLTPTPIKKFRPNQEKRKHGGALAWPL